MTRVIILTIAFACFPGCGMPTLPFPARRFVRSEYIATVRSARSVLPVAVEMERTFPVADHFITHYGFDASPKTWNTEVFFGGRYTLTMQVDVDIDYANQKIIRVVGKPVFYLFDVKEVRPEGDTFSVRYRESGVEPFGVSDWTPIYQSGGQLAALGITHPAKPVKHFDEYVKATRRDRIPISLLKE